MSPHDTLHDRLADAAGAARSSVPEGSVIRRSAVRHRTRRRVLAGSAVVVVTAAVAVAAGTLFVPRTTSTGPATPTPTVTSVPAPTSTAPTAPTSTAPTAPSSTAPSSTQPVVPPPLTREEAQAFVDAYRFGSEPDALASDGFQRVLTDVGYLSTHECDQVPDDRVLAARRFEDFGPDTGSVRQITLFAGPADAQDAFTAMRGAMRPCHTPTTYQDGPYLIDQTVVGGQLELGDESFWVATKGVIREAEGLPDRVGTEQPFKTASLFVRDGNVVIHIEDPAAGDDQRRVDFVSAASAEWEQLRPAYEELRRP